MKPKQTVLKIEWSTLLLLLGISVSIADPNLAISFGVGSGFGMVVAWIEKKSKES